MSALLMAGYRRTYQVPTYVRNQFPDLPEKATAWELATVPHVWADRVVEGALIASSTTTLCAECEDTGFYGLQDPADEDIITDLVKRAGDDAFERLTIHGEWEAYEPDGMLELLDLEVAQDVADVITAGGSGLARRYFMPLAFLPPEPLIAAAPMAEVQEEGWHTYAIVDPLDTGAVLDMVRLAEGPKLERFDGQTWIPDGKILASLMSVKPPPLVELNEEQIVSVTEQISSGSTGDGESEPEPEPTTAAGKLDAAAREKAADAHTALPDGSFPIRNRDELRRAIKALGRAKDKARAKRHIIKRARTLNAVGALPEDWGITSAGLVADAPLTVSPDPRAEKLRRYWSTGKGGLKIRWNTPGDFKRCVKQLRKYMPGREKGYCANLHKRSTGTWPGSNKNVGRRGSAALLIENALVAGGMTLSPIMSTTVASGRVEERPKMVAIKDGIYRERVEELGVVRTLIAGGFPVAPKDDWFNDPHFSKLTPLTVEDTGQVYGHFADFNMAHIGMGGSVRPPRSRTDYAYFKTGSVKTASGARQRVGNLTLTGGHAPLEASAKEAAKHYDDTKSAVADVNVGEDQYGIWFAGALRPDVTPEQVRAFAASALSGDWRPINGSLELVAVCSVNVPGFPIAEALVANGAVMAMVAAGSRGVALVQASLRADAAVIERLDNVEAVLNAQAMTQQEEVPETEEEEPEGNPGEPEAPVVDDVSALRLKKAREAAALRREELRQARRAKVHGTTEAVAAGGAGPKGLTAGLRKWIEWQHPRDMNGRFIEKGAVVDVEFVRQGKTIKRRGTITDITQQGPVVKYEDDGSTSPILDSRSRIEIAPESVARIDIGAHPEAPDRGPRPTTLPKDSAGNELKPGLGVKLDGASGMAVERVTPEGVQLRDDPFGPGREFVPTAEIADRLEVTSTPDVLAARDKADADYQKRMVDQLKAIKPVADKNTPPEKPAPGTGISTNGAELPTLESSAYGMTAAEKKKKGEKQLAAVPEIPQGHSLLQSDNGDLFIKNDATGANFTINPETGSFGRWTSPMHGTPVKLKAAKAPVQASADPIDMAELRAHVHGR